MKYQQLLKFSLLVLCLLVFSSQAVRIKTHTNKATLATAGSAWNSCRNFRFTAPALLTGNCDYDVKGLFGIKVPKKKDSTIDLNNCLGNIDGSFECGSTDYALSAANVTLSGSTISADLYNAVGNLARTSIDLNKVLTNNKGNLQCGC